MSPTLAVTSLNLLMKKARWQPPRQVSLLSVHFHLMLRYCVIHYVHKHHSLNKYRYNVILLSFLCIKSATILTKFYEERSVEIDFDDRKIAMNTSDVRNIISYL